MMMKKLNFKKNTYDWLNSIKIKYKNSFFKREKLINILEKPRELFQGAQDFIEKKFENNDENALTKQSTIWAKYLTYSFIGGTFFGLGWLSIAKTDEVVIAQGKLEPASKVSDIQIPVQGMITKLYIQEGDIVKKDDLLIELDTTITKAKIEEAQKSLNLNQDILDRLENLVKEGAIAEIEFLRQRNLITQLERELIEKKLLLKYQEIRSPVDGIIFNLKATKPGYVATATESIVKVVPIDRLKAKVEVDSNKIGFVLVGKKVEISIDSFPATDFGIIEGSIKSIGSDALPPDPMSKKGYRFPVDIKLNSQDIVLNNKTKLPLQTGMSLTANIKLRKVSYLNLLLGTFQDKAGSLKEI